MNGDVRMHRDVFLCAGPDEGVGGALGAAIPLLEEWGASGPAQWFAPRHTENEDSGCGQGSDCSLEGSFDIKSRAGKIDLFHSETLASLVLGQTIPTACCAIM